MDQQSYELVESIHRKLDAITEKQINHVERLTKLEAVVTNGLTHNVAQLNSKMDALQRQVDEFLWFIQPMTRLRDSFFFMLFKIALAGGVLFIVFTYTSDVVKGLLK